MNTSNSDSALFVKEDKDRSAREKGLEQTTARDFAAFVIELELSVRRVGAEARAAGVLEDLAGIPAPGDYPTLRELTAWQWEILSRLLRGQRVVTIARELFVCQTTVRNHLSTIFGRSAVHSQPELIELLSGRTASGGPTRAGSAAAARLPVRPPRARTHASQLQAAGTGRGRTR